MSKAITPSKYPGFDRRYTDQKPHYEVWYGKVDVPSDRALWFRYKTLNGVVEEASCWGVWFSPEGLYGGKQRWWLDELRAPGPASDGAPTDTTLASPLRFHERHAVFRAGDAHLDDANAIGSAGPIQWDLHWRDSGRRFSYIPHRLATLGIAQSTYDACFLDLRVDGHITCGDDDVRFENATGMVGHIQGSKIAGHSWAWSHCNNFDGEDDVVFEGLSARALLAGRGSPLMTALILIDGEHRYEFHGPIQIFRTQSSFGRDHWRFVAGTGDVRLEGQAHAPADVALVQYTDTDGSHLWCYNSKLASLELELVDREKSRHRLLRSSNRAAFETLTRDKPPETVLI